MSFAAPNFRATDARAYEHFMARWSRRLAGPFLDFVGVKTGDRVLDVGCGTGVITAALAERGCTVVGLDASEPYLEGARADCRRRRTRARRCARCAGLEQAVHRTAPYSQRRRPCAACACDR